MSYSKARVSQYKLKPEALRAVTHLRVLVCTKQNFFCYIFIQIFEPNYIANRFV